MVSAGVLSGQKEVAYPRFGQIPGISPQQNVYYVVTCKYFNAFRMRYYSVGNCQVQTLTLYNISYIIMIVGNRIESLDKFKRIFWDVDVSTVDIDRYDLYIIERILDFGKIQEINWMFDRYSMETIKKALYTRRGLSRMSFSFWKLILGA